MLDYDSYIEKFCEIEYVAFGFVVDENRNNQVDEYRQVLKIENAKNMFMDYTFLMEDDTYIHIEFQTTDKGIVDLRRFKNRINLKSSNDKRLC